MRAELSQLLDVTMVLTILLFCAGRRPPASWITSYAPPPPPHVPALGLSSSVLWELSYGKKRTGARSPRCQWRALLASAQASRARETGVCEEAVSKAEKAGAAAAMVTEYLLGVQRLNSSCTDDASLPRSPAGTRSFVLICNRWTKLLFHSC